MRKHEAMVWSASTGVVAYNPTLCALVRAGRRDAPELQRDLDDWLPIYDTFATRRWLMLNWLDLVTVYRT